MTLNEFSKDVKERIDPKTTGNFWRKVRNVSGSIAAGLTIAIQFIPDGNAKIITGLLLGLSTIISGTSHLDKSKQFKK